MSSSAEDLRSHTPDTVPARVPRAHGELVNKRRIARQATSRVAFEREPLADDDPLLGFEPYRHKQPRANSITPDLQREFVAHLAATGIVTSAARHIGRSMEALYKLRHKRGAEGFARAWDRAVQMGVERLEDTALARAIEGSERKIIRNGEVIATERYHNEALVMFFLKTRLADRYAPGAHVGPGQPLYERIRREIEEERRKAANDPDVLKRIRAAIDRKLADAIQAAGQQAGEPLGQETRQETGQHTGRQAEREPDAQDSA
ncbi:MAG: hypothetical protein AAF494_14525 [Pseudomonadota bacterium]